MVESLTMTTGRSSLESLTAQNELIRYLSLFLMAKEGEGLSPKTIIGYHEKVGKFVSFAGPKAISSIDQSDILLFLAELRKTCNSVSVQSYWVTLRTFFNWLVYNEFILKSPMAKMKKPRAEQHVIRPFTATEIKNMLDLCECDYLGCRNRAIILLLLDTGLRRSEMASVKLSDVDAGRHVIKVMGKGSRERVVAYGKQTSAALARYVVARTTRLIKFGRPDSEFLWLTEECKPMASKTFQVVIRRLGERAGLEGVRCSPHTFRHTFGTSAILNGASMRETQLLLGHATDVMTRHYTATVDSMFAAERHKMFSPVDRLRFSS